MTLPRPSESVNRGPKAEATWHRDWAGAARPGTRIGGFTLLEILIAVSIFAILLAAINGVFYSAMRLQRSATRTVEEALPIQQTLAILKRDLQGIVAPGGPLTGPLQPSTAATGTAANMVPQGASGGGMGQQGSTVFYTCTGAIDDSTVFGDVQKVAYYLKNPDYKNTPGKDLVRLVSRNLLASVQEQAVEQWLMGGVDHFQLAFFDGANWADTWDSTTPDKTTGATNNLPRAIKVQIDLAVNYGEPRPAPVQLLVPIVVQVQTNQTQSTTGGQTQ